MKQWKALTICQPYAHLIMTGEKRVENRTWPTRYRGVLLIHAGKSKSWMEPGDEEIPGLVFGAIVGYANLVDCVRLDERPEHLAWLDEHEHASGPWCWVLESPRRCPEPIPYRGAQGIFNVPDDDLSPVRATA